MNQIIAYVRVSSLQQAQDGESIQRQIEKIKAYCFLKGLQEPEIFSDEGVSGYKTKRAGFNQVRELCLQGEIKTLIVYDLSRLSRSVRATLEFIEDVIQKKGIEFISLQNNIDTTTPTGKAFLAISAVFNQLYRDEIAHKTKAALSHKKAKGEKTGGTIPFGYNFSMEANLEPSASEQAVLGLMRDLRGTGLSLRAIGKQLEAKGIKTKTGKASWNPKVIKGILERSNHAHV